MPENRNIVFGPNAQPVHLTAYSATVLRALMTAAGLTRIVITSMKREARDQARIMFENIERKGVAHQHALYGPIGDSIIDVYEKTKASGATRDAIIDAMAARIVEVGPGKVSRHCSDPNVLNVIDIAPSSVAQRRAFETAVRSDKRVAKFLMPPADPAYHLEIVQPARK